MRSSARSVLPTLVTFFCFVAPLFAQSSAKQQPAKTPRGSVSGKVTIKEKPAAGVVVGLRRSDSLNPYDPFLKALADEDGVYRITNVAPGTYQVSVAAPGYVVGGDGNNSRNVVVGEDENIEGMNFSLVRGGVITGKVTDGDGRPVIGHQVEIYSLEVLDRRTPQQPLFPTTNGQTDDRGIYRVFGIAAGRYKVAAGRGEEGYGGLLNTQVNYTQVFYPDVTDAAKATIVEVTEGSEANGIDITLGRVVQTFSASGRLIDGETGQPVPHVHFGLQRMLGQRVEFVNNVVNSDARGEFVVEGLVPGKYSVMLFANEMSDLRAERVTFDIIDSDVTGVVIKLSKGATVSGVVVLESEDKAAQAQLAQILVRAYVRTNPGFGSSSSSRIGADGSFQLQGLPAGAVNMSLSGTIGPFPPKGFSIARVERDGTLVPRIEVKEGDHVTGVRIVVTYGTATLRGTVKVDNGPLPAGARVLLGLTKPGENTSYLRPPQVDERGHFFLDGIPAGLYELTAQVTGGNIKGFKPIKQNVSLTNGNVTEVTITINLAETANP